MSLPQRSEVHEGYLEPVVTILARIQAELEEIARRIDANQATIAKSTWHLGVGDKDYVRAMQDADLNAQRIAGVAGFLRAVGDAAHPHWHVDTAAATGTLKLSELIRSIGPSASVLPAKDEAASGDLDLF